MEGLDRTLSGGMLRRTLIKGVLVRILIVSMILVAVLSMIAYFYVYNQEKEHRLAELKNYMAQRVYTDSSIFRLAEDNLEVFKEEYLRLYRSEIAVTEEDFWDLYFVDHEGATRMYKEQFDGIYTEDGAFRYGMSSFIGNNQSVDDPDFQRRLVLAYRLLAQMGPGWVNRFANVHASFPENGIVLFWPEEPWGLNARANLPMNELGVIRAATQEENPARHPIWSGLYYDETAEEWVITYQVPVDDEGRHLINPSHDVYLTDIVDRLLSDYPNGGYNFLIGKEGYLIAHPSGPTVQQRWVGELSLDKIEIPSVVTSYRLIKETLDDNDRSVHIIENKQDDSYLAVGELSGPDWWFVSVLPMQEIKAHAHRAAVVYFAQGMVLVFTILGVVYWVLHHQAEKPLRQLRVAAELIGNGEYGKISAREIPLPVEDKNEIGLLATRFIEMAFKIGDSKRYLENIVEERTRELEIANASLQKLSYMDGLTGIYNRRCFDLDLEQLFQEGKAGGASFCLLFADVDHFKGYNDIYGHAEADHVLRWICGDIERQLANEERVYRYGGEEIAILFKQKDAAAARAFGERILTGVRSLQIPHAGSSHGVVTLSAGLAQYAASIESPEQLVKEADRKLYLSKNNGRNRLSV